jgi:hypothetical protein
VLQKEAREGSGRAESGVDEKREKEKSGGKRRFDASSVAPVPSFALPPPRSCSAPVTTKEGRKKVKTNRDDDMRAVPVPRNDLQPLDRLDVANDVIEGAWSVLLSVVAAVDRRWSRKGKVGRKEGRVSAGGRVDACEEGGEEEVLPSRPCFKQDGVVSEARGTRRGGEGREGEGEDGPGEFVSYWWFLLSGLVPQHGSYRHLKRSWEKWRR